MWRDKPYDFEYSVLAAENIYTWRARKKVNWSEYPKMASKF